jgi:proteasome lid subunit RPN8/RPN11
MPKTSTAGKKRRAAVQKATERLTDAKKRTLQGSQIIDSVREEIRAHAREGFEGNKPPQEVCGFIATDGKRQRAFRSPNLSRERHRAFRTCPKAWRKVEDKGWEIIAVYHSHVNEPPVPSPGDKTESEAKHLPFLIVGWPADAWDFYSPKGWKAELIGRPFVHGILDCWAIIRDYYEKELKIVLPDFEREDEWWMKGKNLYLDNFKKAGFVEVSDLRKHDVLLIQLPRTPVPAHAAVYLGDGQILHHLPGRISKIDPYLDGHGYARMVDKIVRHRALM